MSSNPRAGDRAAPQAPGSEPEASPLHALLTLSWRGRWIIAATSILAIVLGVLHVDRRGTVWQVASRLYIEHSGSNVFTSDGLRASGSTRNYVNTQAELLRSTPVLTAALSRPEVAGSPLFDGVQNKIGWLKQVLRVHVGTNDDIVTVALESANMVEACAVVNATVDSYRAFNSSTKKTNVREVLQHLEQEKEQREEEFDKLLEAWTQLLRESGTLGLDRESGASYEVTELQKLSSTLLEARTKEDDLRSRWELGQAVADSPRVFYEVLGLAAARTGITSRAAGEEAKLLLRQSEDLDGQLDRLWATRSGMVGERTPEHPTIRLLDAQIAQLERRAASLEQGIVGFTETDAQAEELMVGEYLSALEQEAQTAADKVTRLTKEVAAQKQRVAEMSDMNAEYWRMDAQVEQERAFIEDLTKRISQVNLADINEGEESTLNIVVLDAASTDTARVTASRNQTLALFLAIGALVGFGLSWLREMFDHRLRTEEDISSAVDLPVLAILPRKRSKGSRISAVQEWEKDNGLSEAARSLRTAVYFGLPGDDGKLIHITSPDKGDGKSTITSQLGIAMAVAGQRTLIIDCDLRSPSQDRLFHIENERGLSSALTENIDPHELVQDVGVPNLSILTTGPIPANPAEMLNSPALGALLEKLAEDYDRILLDSPPVLAVADARVVATKCNASLLVMRADKSTRKHVQAAHEQLLSVGTRILGSVLNATPRGFGYGYGYGYGYGNYGYGRTPADKGALPTNPPARSERREPANGAVKKRKRWALSKKKA